MCPVKAEAVPSLPTRNGNVFGAPSPGFGPVRSQPTYKEWKRFWGTLPRVRSGSFPAYLQGMETQPLWRLCGVQQNVPSLPTRNGNPGGITLSGRPTSVPSLPTRNGNHLDTAFLALLQHVPSLPTRNGNRMAPCHRVMVLWVPSLPTRNGNRCSPFTLVSTSSQFPAYLQGMET